MTGQQVLNHIYEQLYVSLLLLAETVELSTTERATVLESEEWRTIYDLEYREA